MDDSIEMMPELPPSGDPFLDQARREEAALALTGKVTEDFVKRRLEELMQEDHIRRKELVDFVDQRRSEFLSQLDDIKDFDQKLDVIAQNFRDLAILRTTVLEKMIPGMSAQDVTERLNMSDSLKKQIANRVDEVAKPAADQMTQLRIRHFLFEIRTLIFAMAQIFFIFIPNPYRMMIQMPFMLVFVSYWYYNYRKLMKPIFDQLKKEPHV
jgi:hypothetical protein